MLLPNLRHMFSVAGVLLVAQKVLLFMRSGNTVANLKIGFTVEGFSI